MTPPSAATATLPSVRSVARSSAPPSIHSPLSRAASKPDATAAHSTNAPNRYAADATMEPSEWRRRLPFTAAVCSLFGCSGSGREWRSSSPITHRHGPRHRDCRVRLSDSESRSLSPLALPWSPTPPLCLLAALDTIRSANLQPAQRSLHPNSRQQRGGDHDATARSNGARCGDWMGCATQTTHRPCRSCRRRMGPCGRVETIALMGGSCCWVH